MIFGKRIWPEPKAESDNDLEWAKLLYQAHLNQLSIVYMLLTVINDPEAITEETEDQVLEMITDLEYGIARFEEYLV